MTVKSTPLGPGTLILSQTGGTPASVDFSCQLSAANLTVTKSKDDDKTMLCGDVKSGSTTYTAQLELTVDQDLSDPAGVVYFTWAHRGDEYDFIFIPNTAAGGVASGVVVVDPLDVGGDEGGKDMESEAVWDCVGVPTLEHNPAAAAAALESIGHAQDSDAA